MRRRFVREKERGKRPTYVAKKFLAILKKRKKDIKVVERNSGGGEALEVKGDFMGGSTTTRRKMSF